jgi:hypothetical protein
MTTLVTTLKKVTLALFLSIVLLAPLAPLQAATLPPAPDRTAQIQTLLKEIERLKALLSARLAEEATPVVYESKFFDFDFEAVYQVTPTGIKRIDDPEAGVRANDVRLYALFTDIVGKDQAYRYIQDFRVYNDPDADTSAFVETMSGSDKWLMGVNSDDFTSRDRAVRASFIDLFLHEYAHLLLLDEKALVSDFKETFWTTADTRHAARVADANKRFDIMEDYYKSNADRFVSDYATMNHNEDMAETFVDFITKDMPAKSTVRGQKVRFFYTSPEFVAERTRLRENLRALGVVL